MITAGSVALILVNDGRNGGTDLKRTFFELDLMDDQSGYGRISIRNNCTKLWRSALISRLCRRVTPTINPVSPTAAGFGIKGSLAKQCCLLTLIKLAI